MAAVPAELALVRLMEATIRAGATRHLAAAVAAALFRAAALKSAGDPEVEAEIVGRLAAIEPVIRLKVEAAVAGEVPNVPGGTKAWRNVAEHAGFGGGPAALPTTEKEAKRSQRSGRRTKRTEALAPEPPKRAGTPDLPSVGGKEAFESAAVVHNRWKFENVNLCPKKRPSRRAPTSSGVRRSTTQAEEQWRKCQSALCLQAWYRGWASRKGSNLFRKRSAAICIQARWRQRTARALRVQRRGEASVFIQRRWREWKYCSLWFPRRFGTNSGYTRWFETATDGVRFFKVARTDEGRLKDPHEIFRWLAEAVESQAT